MKRLIFVPFVLLLLAVPFSTIGQELKINDLEYFETRGLNVLVYSNIFNGGFNDEKNAGIEMIMHGVTTAQGGAVRLSSAPEQWDVGPEVLNRKVNRSSPSIEAVLRFEDYNFESRVVVTAKGNAVELSVYLQEPVPEELEGKAGFNLEFLPSKYWSKTYLMDGRLNRFSRYVAGSNTTKPNSEKLKQFKGYSTTDDRGTGRFIEPLPLETGHSLLMAPEDPERRVKITSEDVELMVFDGRALAQNGWYVVRSILPKGKTGKGLTWTIEPNAIEGWIREPK